MINIVVKLNLDLIFQLTVLLLELFLIDGVGEVVTILGDKVDLDLICVCGCLSRERDQSNAYLGGSHEKFAPQTLIPRDSRRMICVPDSMLSDYESRRHDTAIHRTLLYRS